jgi:streptogramin lyase
VPFQPVAIAAGPDGNLWFAATSLVGKITPSGAVTTFPLTSSAFALASGPDGNLWFTQPSAGAISRMTPAGEITQFSGMGMVGGLAAGADGNLWFTRGWPTSPSSSAIGRMTTSGAATLFDTIQGYYVRAIAAGPGADLWYADPSHPFLWQIDMSGVQKEFPTPNMLATPMAIVTGPDSNIWFVDMGWLLAEGVTDPTFHVHSHIGRSAVNGTMVEFPLPTDHVAKDIALGADGDLWFTLDAADTYPGVGLQYDGLGRITPSGAVMEVPLAGGAKGIAGGPDGNLWFTQVSAVSSMCP